MRTIKPLTIMINNILFAYLILTIHMLPSDGIIFFLFELPYVAKYA